MAKTTNYQWDLPSPSGIQIAEIAKIATTFVAIDLKLKSTETALSTHKHSFADLLDRPTTLGGYGITDGMTAAEVAAAIKVAVDALLDGSVEALDTLKELGAALGDDPNFAATVSAALGLRVRVDAATNFTLAQKTQGRANIDALGMVDKGAAGGVATLDSGGKVPSTQLPALTTTATVGAAMAGANGKTTPDDGDFFGGVLAGGSTMFKTTWGNIKTAIKDYLEPLNDARYLRLIGGVLSNGLQIIRSSAGFLALLDIRNSGAGDVALRMAGGGRDFSTGTHIEVGQRANGDLFLWGGAGKQIRMDTNGNVFADGGWIISSSNMRARGGSVYAGDGDKRFTGDCFDPSVWRDRWGVGDGWAWAGINAQIEARAFWRSEDWAKSRNRGDQGTYTIAKFRYPGYSRDGNATIAGSELVYDVIASFGSNNIHGGVIEIGTWKNMGSGSNSTAGGSNVTNMYARMA